MKPQDFILNNYDKMSYQEIASILNISIGAVTARVSNMRKKGIIPPPKWKYVSSLETGIKECSLCHAFKPIKDFHKSAQRKDGYKTLCKSCRNILNYKYYHNAQEKRRLKIDSSPELKAQIAIRNKKYRIDNQSVLNEKRKAYRKKENVKKHRKIYINEYTILRRSVDMNFRIQRNWHKRIWDALNGICCSKETQEVLGMNSHEFRNYIESKFKPGMTWLNYGKKGIWELDHIRPASLFNLQDRSQLALCYHYTNLQPLFKEENQAYFNNNKFANQ